MAKTKAKDWKKQILEKYGDVIVSGTNVLNNKKDAKRVIETSASKV